jgi:release factor glutamine methyltransferase
MPSIADAMRAAAERLSTIGIETAKLDAEVLLRHVLQIDRTALFMRLREPMEASQVHEFEELIERRLSGEPVAYITGVREFMGLPFAVGPGVLIPRPETEAMVDWGVRWLGSRGPCTAVDVGTGGGAIVLSLAHILDDRRGDRFIGSDCSSAALAYADQNRSRFSLHERVHLVLGDLLTWLGAHVDAVLANLPYLSPGQVAENPEIHAEPESALISGFDGFNAIERLIADLPRVLAPGGAAMFELDPSQAIRAAETLSNTFLGGRVTVKKDLQGFDRFVIVETE